MFDIGFWEILLILMLALVVLGPERLPQAARSVGYWVGKARRYIEGVKDQVESEFDTTELKRLLHNQDVQIKELQNKIVDVDIKDKMDDVERSLNDAYTNTLDEVNEPEVHHDEAQYEMLEEDDDGGIAAVTESPTAESPTAESPATESPATESPATESSQTAVEKSE